MRVRKRMMMASRLSKVGQNLIRCTSLKVFESKALSFEAFFQKLLRGAHNREAMEKRVGRGVHPNRPEMPGKMRIRHEPSIRELELI